MATTTVASVLQDGEERVAHHRFEAAQAKAEIANALSALQAAQNALLASKLERAIASQRDVELEALSLSKNVNSLYQRAAKWKAEQKRLRHTLEGLETFEDWASAIEIDLQGIAGNLEYVSAVLEKEQDESSALGAGASARS